MGPVNSGHFLPQASQFLAHYHALALDRAGSCRTMRDTLGSHATRFRSYLEACEVEALSLEAVAHHYLEDAWSSGHMWQRWGSTALADFPDRESAVLVAITSGVIHGARGDLQSRVPAWTGLDVADALCAPGPSIAYQPWLGLPSPMLGDLYLDQLATGEFATQHDTLYACATTALREVYVAAGENHGALGASGATSVSDFAEECFGQRATNLAVRAGLGIDVLDAVTAHARDHLTA